MEYFKDKPERKVYLSLEKKALIKEVMGVEPDLTNQHLLSGISLP